VFPNVNHDSVFLVLSLIQGEEALYRYSLLHSFPYNAVS
jgi:hypothetical protein